VEHEGPLLEALTHRLSECPPEFLLAPKIPNASGGVIDVPALVADHFRALGRRAPGAVDLAPLVANDPSTPARLRLIAIATWLLHDSWFLTQADLGAKTWQLFFKGLNDLATVVRPESVVTDPDRREEFVRLCLKHLGLRPRGETLAQAADRLTTLDSVERDGVIRKTRDAEARARAIREKMAEEAAKAAAQRYTPE
jgi:hypothetical protein